MENLVNQALTNFTVIDETHFSAIFNISSDAIVFKGHFPEKPIVPGVLLLEAVRQTANMALKADLKIATVKQVKFKELVLPAEEISINLAITKKEELFHISAQLQGINGLKAKIVITLK